MTDQVVIEILKTVRSLANSQSSDLPMVVDLTRMVFSKVLGDNPFKARMISHGERKINIIKVVREWTGLGLKEAKDFVESAPVNLDFPLDSEKLHRFVYDLKMAGATVEAVL